MKHLKRFNEGIKSDNIYTKAYNGDEYDELLRTLDISDLKKRIRFFDIDKFSRNEFPHIIMFDGNANDKIIGICKIGNYDNNNPNHYVISYCSIDKEYRGEGYLNSLIEGLAKFCKENNYTLGSSEWTVPGMLKLRPTVVKRMKKYDVPFDDHNKRFDYPHSYNSNMINVDELSPEELEEHKRLSRLEPKYKNKYMKKFFYDTGKYKIYSTQTDYDLSKVSDIYNDINRSKYDYFSNRGKIAGYIHNGKYYITEGHHRVLAAISYWKKYKDYKPLDKLIVNGNFIERDPIKYWKFPTIDGDSLYKSRLFSE